MIPVNFYILIVAIVVTSTGNNIPFNINNPNQKIELPKELNEISGLTWYDKNHLATVQDEAGVLYFVDISTGNISDKIRFSSPEDFEGIGNVNGMFYALTSHGTIFSFSKHHPENRKQINTLLSWKNNAEGLGYDRKNNRLLIACKDQPGITDTINKGKAVYALDLSNHTLSHSPVFIIKKSDLNRFFKVEKFKPSAIAVDPLSDDIYLLASAGKLLVVLDKSYTIKTVTPLNRDIYAQPEGICFTPEGDLFISNESNKKRANIYLFYRQQ